MWLLQIVGRQERRGKEYLLSVNKLSIFSTRLSKNWFILIKNTFKQSFLITCWKSTCIYKENKNLFLKLNPISPNLLAPSRDQITVAMNNKYCGRSCNSNQGKELPLVTGNYTPDAWVVLPLNTDNLWMEAFTRSPPDGQRVSWPEL